MSELRSFGHGVEEGGWCVVKVNSHTEAPLYYKYPTRHLPIHADNIMKKDLTREEAEAWLRLLKEK